MTSHLGEILAVTTALMWAFGATFFGMVAKRSSSVLVNAIRLPSGAILLWLAYVITTGELWPAGLGWREHLWLGSSGILGLAIGDSFYYLGITMIGPRRASMVLPATPVIAAVFAWFMLSERLDGQAMLGISIVIAGILVAVLGRDDGSGDFHRVPRARLWRGLLAAAVCAVCSGVGNVFAKIGMSGGLDPLPASLVRGWWATGGMAVYLLFRPSIFRDLQYLRDPFIYRLLGFAVVLGPFLGMWAAVTSLHLSETGVSTVLMNIVPITVLLPAWLFHRDKPSPTAVLGVVIAIGGGALLFLR